ncbi:LysR substrate-binding domain-containing protein [Phreatobacter stygius]|uniref:LysR family transcriptional regulator n=1 Tax=Phreatobacter stygius TaxID=1940610 RepID=A0A4D7BFN1_9HYPH|nr:LysR substrate-binding domain-containing protein [Phreatobacter stygius]QCI69233.1 LysR family transcriptional regulator [Phreatobacter stygius]
MAPPLDLDLVKTFVAVVETGSFSNAAPRIGRSQSAVSMQMQRLELAVGKQLLIRSPRAVTLSQTGEGFLTYARRLLRLSDEAWASVSRAEEAGSVRLGVPDDYAAFLLPPVLSRFAAEHPLVTVELICEPSTTLVKTIGEGRLDLAIVTRSPAQPLEVMRRERLVWVASPHHVAWEDDPLPVALFEPGCAARIHVLRALENADRAYRCTYSSASLLGLIAVVQAGLAVAGLAACSAPPSLSIIGENEGLPPLDDMEIGILRGPAPATAAVDRLNDFLRRDLSRR